MGSLAKINHVVVLMLENRSFDCMLGRLYPKSDGFDGLAGNETNPDNGDTAIRVWNGTGTARAIMTMPDPDPGELWTDMNTQIFGTPDVPNPPTPTMAGFVKSYLAQTDQPPSAYVANSVMHYFSPEQVPVISRLARQFAVCDRWHASAPNQTWPNRFFAHTGTANGYVNNTSTKLPYELESIFNRIQYYRVANGWKIYFHDVPQTLTLARLWDHLDHFRFYEEFRYDAKQGTLPAYSFIEPRYFSDLTLPNDQHPPHVVTLGEQLIADVYNSLRSGPGWAETLLVITYDEHGGCFDHVPPPAARPPSAIPTTPFNFDRYGVRVPAVIVSPYVPQGTVLRPPGTTPFDHTSIIATLRKRFSLGAPLTQRDEAAPDLDVALTLDNPDNLGPEAVQAPPYVPDPVEVGVARQRSLNGMQKALLRLAAHLPASVSAKDDHLVALAALEARGEEVAVDFGKTAGEAAHDIKQKLGALFASRQETTVAPPRPGQALMATTGGTIGRVYFATNRHPVDPSGLHGFDENFNGPAPGQLMFGTAEVAVPPGRTPDGRPNEAATPGAVSLSGVTQADFSPGTKDTILSGPDNLIVSIHGFQYLFWESATRAEYLSRWFNEGPYANPTTVVFFGWPSAGDLGAYERDWNVVSQSGPATAKFLTTIVPLISAFRSAKMGRATVTLLAHSMGNHALASGLTALGGAALTQYDRIILVAADETRGALAASGVLSRCFNCATRLYIYYNNQDIPLLLSGGALHFMDPRLGLDGPPHKRDFKDRNVTFVNASAANFGDASNPKDSERHQYYRMLPEVRDDICAVMQGMADDQIPNRRYCDDPQYGWENFWLIRAIRSRAGT